MLQNSLSDAEEAITVQQELLHAHHVLTETLVQTAMALLFHVVLDITPLQIQRKF